MILVTGSNENYRYRVNSYLATLNRHADFTCHHIGVGYMPGQDFPAVIPLTITREENAGAPPETECIQHGSFVQVLPPGKPKDVIMYTDGDFTMQRAVNNEERKLLTLTHGRVAIGYNGGAAETLLTEYHRLGPKKTPEEMDRLWGKWQQYPIYNVGCVAMNRQTWARLHKDYIDLWGVVSDCFTHQARQQWLISWLISEYMTAVIIPWSLHGHGHFGLKPGMEVRPDGLYVDGQLCLFRHFI